MKSGDEGDIVLFLAGIILFTFKFPISIIDKDQNTRSPIKNRLFTKPMLFKKAYKTSPGPTKNSGFPLR